MTSFIPNFNPNNPGDRYLSKIHVAPETFYEGTVRLTCSDEKGNTFEVARNKIKYFSLYGAMMPAADKEVVLPPSVSAEMLVLILEFLDHYIEDSEENHDKLNSMVRCTPLDTLEFGTKVPKYYDEFMSRFELYDPKLILLTKAVLDIGFDVMRYVICANMACRLKMKTPEEMCAEYRVPPPTDAEIELIRGMVKEVEEMNVNDLMTGDTSSSSAAASAGKPQASEPDEDQDEDQDDDQDEDHDEDHDEFHAAAAAPSAKEEKKPTKLTLTAEDDEDEDALLKAL